MPGGDHDGLYDDIVNDGILESLIIIMLAGALVVLIYWRQQHQLRHRGEQQAVGAQQGQQNGQPQQEDRGVFPQPGDPDFNAWLAGGVGH
jgi:SEL1 protein